MIYLLQPRKRILMNFLVGFTLVVLASCQVDRTGKDLRAFQAEIKLTEDSLARSNLDEAEMHCKKALDTATRMEWSDGIVMSKRRLADIKAARGDFADAEARYNDARDLCLQSRSCSSGQLASITDSLITINLFRLRNPNRVLQLVEDTIRNRRRFDPDEDLNSIIRQYCGQIKAAGFVLESARCLEIEHDSNVIVRP